jgi:hypothetical protein
MAVSAYIPAEYDGWLLMMHDLAGGFEWIPGNTPSFGYASWPQSESFFLSMTTIEGEFYILHTSNYTGISVIQTIAKGKYPAVAPDGARFVYRCSNQSYLCIQDVELTVSRLLTPVQSINVLGQMLSTTAWWSRDGNWIYFSSALDGDWDIYRIRPDGSDLQNLTGDWPTNELMPALR